MNITEPTRAWARKTPDAPAVLTEDGTLSYAELNRAVSWTARTFEEAGMAAGDAVSVNLTDSLQHLITLLALVRLGVGHIAFHVSDPPNLQQDIARRIKMVASIGGESDEIVTGVPLVSPPPGGLGDIRQLKTVDMEPASGGELPWLYMLSSGTTTGVSKLGLLTHEKVHHRLEHHTRMLPRGPGTRFHSMININFFGAKQRILGCLAFGGCVALLDRMGLSSDYVSFVSQHNINFISCTPIHVAVLLKNAGAEDGLLFPDVDAFRVGTTFVRESLRRKIQERLCLNIYVGYGSNEVGIISIAAPEQIRTIPGSVGCVEPGVEIEIVDKDGQALPPGKIGQIRVKSLAIIDGYFDDPDETARVFRNGWFYMGDLVEVMSDGVLVHHGRADDLMILDGINIYPAEIENVLLLHPAVAEAAAFPIRSVMRGDIPVVAVVIKSQVSKDELISHCRSLLGLHAPHGLMIVPKLPINAVGKVLKNELPKIFRDHQRQNS